MFTLDLYAKNAIVGQYGIGVGILDSWEVLKRLSIAARSSLKKPGWHYRYRYNDKLSVATINDLYSKAEYIATIESIDIFILHIFKIEEQKVLYFFWDYNKKYKLLMSMEG